MRSEFAPASDPEANQWLDIMIGQGTTLAKDLLQMGNRQRLFRRNRGTGPRGRGRRDTTASYVLALRTDEGCGGSPASKCVSDLTADSAEAFVSAHSVACAPARAARATALGTRL
ncbi:hypothetical protein MCOR31_010148 [Pyricularia oryzae]|uniref:Uncharacterized protein n=1 Tax=Pyricularia grisea TaxID=148305 RepID=A0ABQ8N8C5_PYRGI|nr:hypothetical protein MCOR33_009500 [Pyricularia grisea]KAI6335523.1 hypothetical protein MCOR30_003803 [Pyricularia oryzae]KAI6357789.1 hypothetical protein MCOR31_010148 [Pyricularia oryzae]KAI6391649.1 hypothetical protein MCOR23_008869 [Pyricularia oryzae]KAI6435763.1 hypothetical protein MCOR21_001509 [Pyricularia oryzae]